MKPVAKYISTVGRSYTLTPAGEKFIRDNWDEMDNTQLAEAVGVSLDKMRVFLHARKMYRMVLEYWTEEQVAFLKQNYKTVGDKELAIMFNLTWPKDKTWTWKHIEKKRMYLKLKRTKSQLQKIKKRNASRGAWSYMNTWGTRGRAPVGEIRIWKQNKRPYKVIKTADGFRHYLPWLWEQHFGPIPEGMKVTTKDGNNLNAVPENLKVITLIEQGERAAQVSSIHLSDGYIAGHLGRGNKELRELLRANKPLLEIKRQQLILQREILKAKHESA